MASGAHLANLADAHWRTFSSGHGFCLNALEDVERLAHIAFLLGVQNGALGTDLSELVKPDDESLACDSECRFIERSFVAGCFFGRKVRCDRINEWRVEKLRTREMMRVVEELKPKYKSSAVMRPDGSMK